MFNFLQSLTQKKGKSCTAAAGEFLFDSTIGTIKYKLCPNPKPLRLRNPKPFRLREYSKGYHETENQQQEKD